MGSKPPRRRPPSSLLGGLIEARVISLLAVSAGKGRVKMRRAWGVG